jgi:hypothetical protein
MATLYSEGVTTAPEGPPVTARSPLDGKAGQGLPGTTELAERRFSAVPASIEPVFAMRPCHHERLFGVKRFVERVFAFATLAH